MPKNNKITERVFADVFHKMADTDGHRGEFERFLAVDHDLGLKVSKHLEDMKNRYSDVVKNIKEEVEGLAVLEEIIIQLRAKQVIDSELRLSLSRNYIYARSKFYRKEKEMDDIRVVVGKTEDYGDDLEKLIQDQEFRAICKARLEEAMDKEIQENINILNTVVIF